MKKWTGSVLEGLLAKNLATSTKGGHLALVPQAPVETPEIDDLVALADAVGVLRDHTKEAGK